MIYLDADMLMQASEPGEIMDRIELAYTELQSGRCILPERIHVDHQDNTVLYMPCFLDNIFGTKILTLFPGNMKKNLPVISGLVMLNDASTGRVLALLEGARLTALRTGAVGGLAIRHLAPETVSSAGLIGAGVQGFYQLFFAAVTGKFKKFTIFDLDSSKVNNCCKNLGRVYPELTIKKAESVEELLEESEVVITATPSENPVLPDKKELLANKLYIGIGSYKPEMREYPRALYKVVDRVLIDTAHGLQESGDLITPLHEKWLKPEQITEFAEFLTDKDKVDKKQGTILFKSVGMALFDLAVGELLYRKALDQKIGIHLNSR